jgi:hypothetical protein
VNLPAGYDNDTTIGRFWQAGARPLANEGTFEDSQWLRPYPANGKWYILGELGTAGVLGCPAGSVIVTLDTLGGHNMTAQVDETGGVFDLTRFQTDLSFGLKPRPTVHSSHREGSLVVLELGIVTQSGGIYTLGASVAATPSYQLVYLYSASDPGPLASAYTIGPVITPGTLVSFPLDCANPVVDLFLAIQTIVDGVPSDTVGARTRAMCGHLAEPGYKQVNRPSPPHRRER